MKQNPNAVSSSIVTRNIADITGDNGNVYEAIAVISKRANQLSVKLKEELNERLAEFASTVDNLEEVFENREQIEVSKQYERMPKPTSLAIEEFLQGKIHYSTPAPEEVPDFPEIDLQRSRATGGAELRRAAPRASRPQGHFNGAAPRGARR